MLGKQRLLMLVMCCLLALCVASLLRTAPAAAESNSHIQWLAPIGIELEKRWTLSLTGRAPYHRAHSTTELDPMINAVSGLEQKTFGHTFKDEVVTARIVRLEQKRFGGPHRGAINRRIDALKL